MTTWWAVYHGRVPGVYTTWADCCAQVAGVENNQYKGFKCREEAEASFWEYMASHPSANRPTMGSFEGNAVGDNVPGQLRRSAVLDTEGADHKLTDWRNVLIIGLLLVVIGLFFK